MSTKISKVLGARGASVNHGRAGILVLERLPQETATQLRAFVWCRRHPARPALPDERQVAPHFPLLMVGLARNGEDDRLTGNGRG